MQAVPTCHPLIRCTFVASIFPAKCDCPVLIGQALDDGLRAGDLLDDFDVCVLRCKLLAQQINLLLDPLA